MRLRSLGCALSAALAVLVACEGHARAVVGPPAFAKAGSNGYRITVIPQGRFPQAEGTLQSVALVVTRPGASTTYSHKGRVGHNFIRVRLGGHGQRGRVDVRFHQRGRKLTSEGCRKRRVRYGTFAGKIRFRGEDGYTTVDARRARSTAARAPILDECEEEGIPQSPAAGWISVGSFAPRSPVSVRFGVVKSSPGAPSVATATYWDDTFGRELERQVWVTAAPEAFTYDADHTRATIALPPPFSGRATYVDEPDREPSWKGSLRVSFPGQPGVPLTDGPFQVSFGPQPPPPPCNPPCAVPHEAGTSR